jgi:hypothetical protein
VYVGIMCVCSCADVEDVHEYFMLIASWLFHRIVQKYYYCMKWYTGEQSVVLGLDISDGNLD